MEIIYKKVDELIPYINNSRTHNKEQIMQIVSSIKEFGFTNPILIDENNGIIAGHGRLLASKKLNMEEVPCIILEGLTEAQKKAYVIADNKLALNSGWNDDLLRLELESLKDTEFDLNVLGFSKKELDKLFLDDENEENLEPEVQFTEVLGEEHNYIVLYFDNEVDWLQAESIFDLEQVQNLSTRKDGKISDKMVSYGIGRVINGRKAINKIIEGKYENIS